MGLDKFTIPDTNTDTTPCLNPRCSKLFTPKSSDLTRGWGLYCSKSCSVTHRLNARRSEKESRKIKLQKIINNI